MYKAKQTFIASSLGRVKKGQKVADSIAAKNLFERGYLDKVTPKKSPKPKPKKLK